MGAKKGRQNTTVRQYVQKYWFTFSKQQQFDQAPASRSTTMAAGSDYCSHRSTSSTNTTTNGCCWWYYVTSTWYWLVAGTSK